MKNLLDRTIIGLAIATVVLIAAAFVMPDWVRLVILQSLARGSVALGLLILWRSGLVSFGHALFFATGGYAAVLMQRTMVNDALMMALAGLLAGGLLAFGLGFLLRRYRGIFFALLNMAFSMVLWGLLAKNEALGSTDGLGVATPKFFGIELESNEANLTLYVCMLIVCLVFASCVHLYLRSTLGSMSTAVRENEIRLEYLGYSGERAVHVKYVISGLLGGFGGAVMAMSIGQVDPDSMAYWTISGEFVVIALLGGTGSVAATFIGAIVFEGIRSMAFQFAPKVWQLIMGGTLLAIIMFLPAGLWSLVERKRKSEA